MMNHPKNMYEYHNWAITLFLNRMKELPDNVLYEEVKSSYSSIAKTFSHIYAVDSMWLNVLKGVDMQEALQSAMELMEKANLYSVDEFIISFEKCALQYEEWMNEQDLERKINVNNPWSGPRETSFAEILLHIANHGTYHRGNITTMLRQQGYASISNDFSSYWYHM